MIVLPANRCVSELVAERGKWIAVRRGKSDISALDPRRQATTKLPTELNGVQGVAGSNPAVPTRPPPNGGGRVVTAR